MRYLGLIILLAGLAAACKDDNKIPTVDFDTTTTNNDSDTSTQQPGSEDTGSDTHEVQSTDSTIAPDSSSDNDSDTATTPFTNDGPLIQILYPPVPNLSTLTSDEIVTDKQLEIRCEVLSNPETGELVNAQSVEVAVTSGDETRTATAALNTQTDTYSALLYVGDWDNGEITVSCAASDLATPISRSIQERVTYLDLGPTIAFYSPQADTAYGSAVEVQIQMSRNPVSDEDPAAPMNWSRLEVLLSGVDIRSLLSNSPSQPNLFSGTISFNDPIFDPPIDGINTLVVRIPNTRVPEGVVREAEVTFTADSTGPVITPVSPVAGDILGGQVEISATVTDASGVAPLSVVATIAGEYEVQLINGANNHYSGIFDSRVLDNDMVYPNITIRALDTLGNQNAFGFIVSLDNSAPLAALDPPPVRESRLNNLYGNTECSWMFDALGGWDPNGVDPYYGDSADDGESVGQLFEVRARLEDLGNMPIWTPGIETPNAGVNGNSVKMYLLDDTTQALIVDTNGDGFCDSINPLLLPSSLPSTENEAIVINLTGLSPTGGANFTSLPAATEAQPAFDASEDSPEAECTEGSATSIPFPLCSSSPVTRVIPSTNGGAAIFVVPPANSTLCMGSALDALALNLNDGWVCIAVKASDVLGNIGISAPLRVCIDHDGDGAECAPWGTITTDALPDCTGTFNAQTDEADVQTTCVLREQDLVSTPLNPRSLLFEDYPQLQLIPR